MSFKMIKSFDCIEMSRDVIESLFDSFGTEEMSCIEYEVHEDDTVGEWLIKNGAFNEELVLLTNLEQL